LRLRPVANERKGRSVSVFLGTPRQCPLVPDGGLVYVADMKKILGQSGALRGRGSASMWVAVAGIASLYIGSTLPTPLYPVYRREFGFSEFIVTAIYASYVIGNLIALFALGRLSDQLGRRPTTLMAFAVLFASVLCFLAATGTAWLFMARALNGLAAGLGAGALTAWIAELEPRHDKARAAVVASTGNLAGLGLGALIAGLLAQYGPWPLRSSYAVYLIIMVVIVVLTLAVPEGVEHPVRNAGDLSLRPRIGVPRNLRLAFIAPAAMAFATFALGGFYAALAPGLLFDRLQQHNLAMVGALVALFFGTGAFTAAKTGSLTPRPALLSSTILLLIGLALLVTADHMRSMVTLVIATVVSGGATALGYRCSLQIVNEIAPADQRAELVSSYLLVCYTANSLPVIGVGLLSLAVGAVPAHLAFAVLLAVLSVTACATGWRFLPRQH
jgi:Major Facilitator Superfamily